MDLLEKRAIHCKRKVNQLRSAHSFQTSYELKLMSKQNITNLKVTYIIGRINHL